ncbi:MAG: hypothetical protein AB1656_12885 [Candidatus Omnitrophota bacterium]
MLTIIIYAILLFVYFTWLGECLKRLPCDLGLIKEYSQEKNWSDFGIEILVFVVIWALCIIPLVVFVPRIVSGYSAIAELFSSFRF